MTDILGGVGTALIQLVVGQILYAQQNNLKPWVYLNNRSDVFYDPKVHRSSTGGVQFKAMVGRNASYSYPLRQGYRAKRDMVPGSPKVNSVTQQKLSFSDTDGVWKHYFEPVSDFVPGDRSCESKLYVTMDLYLITPGIHGFSQDFATRCWRYEYLPEYISQPYIPLHEWFLPQRIRASRVMKQFFRFRPYLRSNAALMNPNCDINQNPCLGLHIRHSDKAAGRRQIHVDEFLPFAVEFVKRGGTQIYVATDSALVLDKIQKTWPENVTSHIVQFARAPDSNNKTSMIRSSDQRAVFDMASHHRTNQEGLVEILALSQCQFLIHGFSALSEASIWLNLDLHYRSVNLEDKEHIDPATFGRLIRKSFQNISGEELPSPPRTNEFYKRLLVPRDRKQNEKISTGSDKCDAYEGVLHIAAVGGGSGPGRAFFTSVVNQLLLADELNLIPWIHLAEPPSVSEALYDQLAHTSVNETRHASTYEKLKFSAINSTWALPPQVKEASATTRRSFFNISGSNVWGVYFDPFMNNSGEESCALKPLLTLNHDQVSKELEQLTDWAVRPWQFDGVVDHVWNPKGHENLRSIMWDMRRKGSQMVSKYFHPRKPILDRVEDVNPKTNSDGSRRTCLAVHVRITEKKGKHRRHVPSGKYIKFMEAYVRAGGNLIYIGTDSSRALRHIMKASPDNVKDAILTQGVHVVRSSSKTLPPYALDENHHRVNSETLVDIYAMARCHFLVHSFSAVAEAVIYVNPQLHNNSINLEDSAAPSPTNFERMASNLIVGNAV